LLLLSFVMPKFIAKTAGKPYMRIIARQQPHVKHFFIFFLRFLRSKAFGLARIAFFSP